MKYKDIGEFLRKQFKDLIFEYMNKKEECQRFSQGLKQAEIFRDCGMDWGEKDNATSSNQQYWIVALLRELEEEQKIVRDFDTKKWRLK